VSIRQQINEGQVPDLKEMLVQRDRSIALAFVAKGCTRTARREIHQETGIELRTIYRAINRQLAWAKAQTKKRKKPQAGAA
jgi:DNA invertase Pin-like site-specific DNA recombinase